VAFPVGEGLYRKDLLVDKPLKGRRLFPVGRNVVAHV
jgi:hypothetical protein